MKCQVCEKEIQGSKFYKCDKQVVCFDCLTQGKAYVCDECGCVHDETLILDEEVEVYNFCPACVEKATRICSCCGELHIVEYMEDICMEGTTEPWCFSCISENTTKCGICQKTIKKTRTLVTNNRDQICQECVTEKCKICENCGEIIPTEEIILLEEEGNQSTLLCRKCYDALDTAPGGGIREYSYKPTPKFFFSAEKTFSVDSGNTAFYGVELEIGKGGENSKRANKVVEAAYNIGAIYVKHDGSVNSGFELVTHPCSVSFHKKNFPWRDICKKAIMLGYEGHTEESCGMHVHVGKKYLGQTEEEIDETVGKIIVFVENNWGSIVKFSRRSPGRLNDWAGNYSESISEADSRLVNKKQKCKRYLERAKNAQNRRKAINITNKKTLEFRLFRSTLNPTTINANIQLCHLICTLAKQWSEQEADEANFSSLEQLAESLDFKEWLEYTKKRGMI